MDGIVLKAIFTAKCIKENKTIWKFVINMKSFKLLLEHKMKNPKWNFEESQVNLFNFIIANKSLNVPFFFNLCVWFFCHIKAMCRSYVMQCWYLPNSFQVYPENQSN